MRRLNVRKRGTPVNLLPFLTSIYDVSSRKQRASNTPRLIGIPYLLIPREIECRGRNGLLYYDRPHFSPEQAQLRQLYIFKYAVVFLNSMTSTS